VPPPAADFFRLPEIDDAELSPSGEWLAVAVPVVSPAGGSRRALAVFDLAGRAAPQRVAGFADRDIGRFRWVGDELLVFDLFDRERGSADQPHGPGLFAVQRDGAGLRQLVALAGQPGRGLLSDRHTLLHVPVTQPVGEESVIVALHRLDRRGEVEDVVLRRLLLRSGRIDRVPHQPRGAHIGWLLDDAGEPRLAVQRPEPGVRELWLRAADGWRRIGRGAPDEAAWRPHSLDGHGRLLVLQRSGPQGEATLRRFDEARGAPAPEPLVDTPGFDLDGGLLREPGDPEALGVRVELDAETTVWFDPGLAAVQRAVDARLPGRVNRLSCRRCRSADRRVLVHSHSDRHPGEYWLWRGEAEAPSVWRPVGRRRPAIDAERMGQVEFQRIRARDGLSVPLWITTPAGTPPGRALPTVLLVHGGPWVRGHHWRWDGLSQFLASRGWRVLAPEFRGSTGYGDTLHRAGWRQWGRAMQDDLADAVDWGVAQGLVDGRRVCIVGASYGGYAALMGVIRHPEHFRCAAAWVAVTEPRLLFEHRFDSDSTDEVRTVALPRRLADPEADAAMLRDISPVEQAGRIRAPLLLAWGEKDRRVPRVHGDRLQQALRAAGHRDHEVVFYEGEGHSWLRIDTFTDFALRLERLLARELNAPVSDTR
jgi:dienelactone hydrolase